MHEYWYFDGMISRQGEMGVSLSLLTSTAGLYNKGVFTTIAIRGGEPFLWAKHWTRIASHAQKLGIAFSHGEDATRNALEKLIGTNRVTAGRARITIFDTSPSPFWTLSEPRRSLLLITTSDPRSIAGGIKLGVSPYLINSTSPLSGVKSCNYLEQVICFGEAKKSGFDESIRLNERAEVTSASMANIFWTKNAKLYTPSLATGCLAGTTREHVLENVETIEVEAGMDTLDTAEQIFLTSAGLGVVAVCEFNGRKLAVDDHPILNPI